MNRKFSNSKGISLISLIITIIVIIILAAIVIFSGMDTPEKAQLSKVISDIDNVQTAVDQAYYGLYTEKAVAGEVWTKSQFYEAVATGKTNRDDLKATGLVEISEDSLVDINLPKYEGRKWYIAVSDMSDTVKVGSAVLSPGFESQGKIYATLLDVQTGGSTGSETAGSSGIVEPENIDDWIYTVQEDNTVVINRYKGSATEVVIPNYIDGMPVVALEATSSDGSIWDGSICNEVLRGSSVIKEQQTIEKVVFSEGIINISKDIFKYTRNLKQVILPSTLASIGDRAFSNCTSLESITIPSSVTSIGVSVFYNCTNLKKITIPSSVTSIGSYVFGNCTSLTSVTIPSSVTSIGDHAFANCTSLSSITIPNNVTSIESYAFNNCTSLTSVTISSSVMSIGDCAFSNCSSLTSATIPSSVTSIGDIAFASCTSLTSVTIPSSVITIGFNAFRNISSSAQIKCEASSKPSGWASSWTDCTNIIWGAK